MHREADAEQSQVEAASDSTVSAPVLSTHECSSTAVMVPSQGQAPGQLRGRGTDGDPRLVAPGSGRNAPRDHRLDIGVGEFAWGEARPR